MNRVPISFNFQIPDTLTVSQGEVKRWYYSTDMGQIRIHNPQRSWYNMVTDKLDDPSTPSLITYRNLTQKEGASILNQDKILRDVMSAHRATKLL